jgi:hypothetical protein
MPFHRVLTNIVVGNSVPSGVNVYRATLTSVPIATNSVGNNNTLSGRLRIPAGQQFFVQWTAAGNPVSAAFARVSMEKSEDPLDDAASSAATWDVNAITTLILPTGHDPNVGAVIVLDGSTGLITVIGTGGGKIVIDPTTAFPQLHFFSNDGTNDAFINAVSGGSNVDIGINSGIYTPTDTVPRRGRLFFHDSVDLVDLSIINQATQARQGGFLTVESDGAFWGYHDAAIAGGPYDWYMQAASFGFMINAPGIFYAGVVVRRAVMLTQTNNWNCSATTLIGGAFTPIPGCSHTYTNLRPNTIWRAVVTTVFQFNAGAGNIMNAHLIVGGVTQTELIREGPYTSSPVVTSSQQYQGTFVAGGSLTFTVEAIIAAGPGGVGDNMLINDTTLHVDIFE